MGEKRETLEEVAKREADAERRVQEARETFLANRELLAKEVPARFFIVATGVKEAVQRFNKASIDQKVLQWTESAALAARDTNLQADFSLEFWRPGARVQLGLTQMSRSAGPDVFLIEASGEIKDERFLLRAEGFVEGPKKIGYRMSINFKRLSYSIDELPERLVLAAVKYDLTILQQP
jgi:hypothetical protein